MGSIILEAFLFRVAQNKAIDFFRAARRNPTLQDALWYAMTDAVAKDHADDLLIGKNAETLIREAVQQLSPQRRKVFELRNDEELSYAEIAETLRLSTNTVRNHLAASVQFIREYLRKNNALLLLPPWFFEKML